jgi:beta-galactosidase GanA
MMKMKTFAAAIVAALFPFGLAGYSQGTAHPIPSIAQQNGRYALMVDGAPFLMLGAQANNSSDWPATLPKVWPAIEYLHANTLEIPIYWEQFEPRQGQFDYSQIDSVLAQARAHRVHLVLLWFGTWKNGSQHYMPEWMKLDPERYSHVVNKNGERMDSPSPFARASLDADIRAFTAFMRHLKAVDPERTVLMVQVENETGTWGTLRDYSAEANKLFTAAVPDDVLNAMNKTAAKGAGWAEVFGPDADVYFHAWAIARYVGEIALAGKAVYPLPLYVNAALRDPFKGAPGTYESGGPTDNVLSIWKAEAPAIDVLAPDIYLLDTQSYLKVLEMYHRPDNALFIPETAGTPNAARFLFAALGMQTIGYSPFGLDYTRTNHPERMVRNEPNAFLDPTAQNYKLLAPMMRDVARLNFEGKLQAVAEVEDQLVAQLSDNQFLVTGFNCRVDFRPAGTAQQQKTQEIVVGTGQTPSALIDGNWQHRQFLRVEEGAYENGVFQSHRILNGDQTDWGLDFGSDSEVLQVSLATY